MLRRVLMLMGMLVTAFLTTWLLFHCWPQAKAVLSWEWRGTKFLAFGPIAVFFGLLLLFLFCFWRQLLGREEPPFGPKNVPGEKVPPMRDPGTGPAAEYLRDGQRLYLRGYQMLAIEKYIKALRLADKAVKQRAHANLGIARCYALLGENSVARAYYEEARKLYQQEQDRLGEANVLLGLGDLERKLGQNEAARRNYEEARKLYQQEQDRLGEANVLLGLGDLERKLGQNEAARRNYEEARKLYQQEQNRLGEANVLLGLGDLERKLGQNEAARRNYEEARKLFQSMGMEPANDPYTSQS